MTSPSAYFPETFDLSDGPVQAVVTSDTDPRVVYDSNGFRATDVNGALLFDLDATDGSAEFAGHIHAKSGVDVDVAAGEATTSKFRWLTVPGGTSVAELFATAVTTPDQLGATAILRAIAGGLVNASSQLQLVSSAGTDVVGLSTSGTGIGFRRSAFVSVNGVQKTLLDAAGVSKFLQLAANADLRMSGPTLKTITWAGGTTQSTNTLIPHGLTNEDGSGRIPLIVLAIHNDNNSIAIDVRTITYGNTTFTLDVIASVAPPAGTTDRFRWLAIG